MVKLDKNEMMSINAGGITAVGWAVIAATVSFIAGLLDGYARPFKCR